MEKKFSFFDLSVKIILGILAAITVIPFINVLMLSFSKAGDFSSHKIFLVPSSIDFSSYKFLWNEGRVTRGLLITLIVTVCGTAFSMLITTAGAYALSKKSLPGRNLIFNCIIITMFFSGGLVPYFLTIQSLHLVNNILVMIIPVAVNTFYLILMKNFFNTTPKDIEEAAMIDGANDISILFRIVLPISKPIIAAISLFYAVDRWNEWWNAMLFINDTKLYPLQLVLRETITNVSAMFNSNYAYKAMSTQNLYVDSIKAAMIIITVVPILMVYPFLQKYFSSGIMIGSIKG